MDKKFKRTTVTSALPYANGPVHIGHLAGVYVPADIYVRYLRLKKQDVLFIGGSDEHGVPITIRAKKEEEAEKLVHDAHLLEEAGCFAIVLEKIPAALAARVAQEVSIPVIGIGAGGGVDGQVLVIHDMLGINQEFSPRFLRRYHNLYAEISGAVGNYIADVKSGDFPNEREQY